MSDSNIRLSRPTDLGGLVALDSKCYPYPLTMDDWQALVKTSGQNHQPRVVILEVDRKPVGFATWIMKEDLCHIVRLGIKKTFNIPPGQPGHNQWYPQTNYRRHGLGSKLMGQCILEASREKKKKIRIYIPETHCIPDDPDNVVDFLNHNGLKPTGEIVKDFGIYYGDKIEAYVFERAV